MQGISSRKNCPRNGFFFIAAFLVLLSSPLKPSAAQIDKIGVLRDLLDSDFDTAIEHLAAWNRTLIRDLLAMSPDEAVEAEAKCFSHQQKLGT